ncbi:MULTISPECIES: carbohydrate ABC transporter permease [Afifella]|uniref:Maltose/maltodextrin transport system permease protein MalG n=1 Tax=Afifella marina DSM 2698 TaxID=1120955 RepID=A0A1G5NWA7_AFIMA|nr:MULTISPECIES: carbohydrate ABC transporter permease [Afifella]MBK1624051.1 carbohydrate ABC transporter permease [Afifella marina DSM 2698]MBK1627608.1 carbohydrate ABC transporter permease [Afifella marina]MBK5916332.1 sugar ABC transporter permease [Afifella marina]MCT8266394.1 carbohydrate ABC transporter permease [Afifella sp. JA880]RAI20896.1 sugar ABC transporter permease [Afifella marina DSM 2698]
MKQPLALRVVLHALAILVAVIILAPILWLLLVSVSTTTHLTTLPFEWIPEKLNFDNYAKLTTLEPNSRGEMFLYAMRNTALVAFGATAIALCAAVPAAWSFSRSKGGQSNLLYVVVATYMLPPVALIVPLFAFLNGLGLLNTKTGLMLVDCSIVLPFTTWLLKSNFDNISHEIEEAAFVDGASMLTVLRSVTLPMAKPALATVVLFSILLVWDEFFYAFILTNDDRSQTLTVAIANLASGRVSDYGLLATAGILTALPPLIIGILLQRALVSGLAQGGVKG